MKKLVSGLIACVMLFSLAGCNLSNKTVEESKGKISSTEVKVEKFMKKDGKIDQSLENVIKVTVHGLGSDYEDHLNLEFMDESSAADNKSSGIVNYGYIWYGDLERHVGDKIYDTESNIYVFEFDTSSKEYKDLDIGSSIIFYRDGESVVADVTAINQQYVLSIYACETVRNGEKTVEKLPQFTLANTQGGYTAFTGIK